MKRAALIFLVCAAAVSAVLLASCSDSSSKSDDTIHLSECQLTKPVEYDGVAFMVDPSWPEDMQEGICTWTIDEQSQTKLIVTTYTSHSDGDPEVAKCKMHLDKPEHGAYLNGLGWRPYEDNDKIEFAHLEGRGKNADGKDMYDYILAGLEWRDGDFYIASGNEFMIELVTNRRNIRDEEALLKDITDTVQWDPSKTVLDSVELGCTIQRSPLDVR